MRSVFISGSTGYIGRPLTALLVAAGCDVFPLTRPQSIRKLPLGCTPVLGDALDASTFSAVVPPGAAVIHLTGVAHPSPAKGREFRNIDQVAFEASLAAALAAKASHFLYLSVAHPAPVMRDYIAVRRECEARLIASGLPATIFRPWYVLGPGHRWPCVFLPFYKLAELIPASREAALRLGLVNRRQMLAAIVEAVWSPPHGVAMVGVDRIRRASLSQAAASPPPPPPPPRSTIHSS